MYEQVEKPKENISRAVANSVVQKKSNSQQCFGFADNRPEAIAQRKLQEMANNNSQAKKATQLQAMVNNHSSQQHPIQKKENKTGLPDNLKTGIENLSGYSMDDVKVHYNSDKPAQLQAHAYAQGTDIHLGPGQEKHLPHEVWHVVQQKQGRVKPTMQMRGKVNLNDDIGLENEADVMGERAIQVVDSPAIQPVKHGAASNGVAQLVSDNLDHFQEFLKQKSQGKINPANINEFMVAKAAAFILDHNSYKNTHQDLPYEFARYLNYIPASGNPQDYLNIVQTFIQTHSDNTISRISWGPLTAHGIGTSMHIVFGPGKQAQGTPAKDKTPWMELLTARGDGDKTLYVMGHLLNADLGGPGLDYNYVPLPGRAGWYGANDANGLHSKLIEQIVKQKFRLLGSGVTNMEYTVTAIPRQQPRPETQQVYNTLGIMDAIQGQLQFDHNTPLGILPPDFKTKLENAIKSHPVLEAVLYAVSSKNYWNRYWTTLRKLVAENYGLWVYEDSVVPEELKTSLKWTQDGIQQVLDVDIPIALPNNVSAPYKSNRKSSHGKSSPELHESQFQDFLNKRSDASSEQLPEAVQGDANRAKGAAFLLDQNEYDREELIDLFKNLVAYNSISYQLQNSGLQDDQPMTLQVEQAKYREAINLLNADPQLSVIANSPAAQQTLGDLLKLSSAELIKTIHDYISNYHQRTQTPSALSTFVPEGETPWGSPSKITATLKPDGHPAGSSAGGDPAWMLMLEERRDSSKTLYVRGHMINRHLGGAGLDSNMVPLTGREGWYGANNANGIHSAGIEETVKYLYKNMAEPGQETDLSKVTNLVYSVEAVFGNHNRPQTTMVTQLTQGFDSIINDILASLTALHSQKSTEALKESYLAYSTNDFVLIAQTDQQQALNILLQRIYELNKQTYGEDLDPTQGELKDKIIADSNIGNATAQEIIAAWHNIFAEAEYQKIPDKSIIPEQLARVDLKTGYNKPITTLSTVEQAEIESQINQIQYLKPLLNAVSPTSNYRAESLLDLQSYMRSNRDLWQFEDANVPIRLMAKATWNQYGHPMDTGFIDIPNTLPSDLGARYIER